MSSLHMILLSSTVEVAHISYICLEVLHEVLGWVSEGLYGFSMRGSSTRALLVALLWYSMLI